MSDTPPTCSRTSHRRQPPPALASSKPLRTSGQGSWGTQRGVSLRCDKGKQEPGRGVGNELADEPASTLGREPADYIHTQVDSSLARWRWLCVRKVQSGRAWDCSCWVWLCSVCRFRPGAGTRRSRMLRRRDRATGRTPQSMHRPQVPTRRCGRCIDCGERRREANQREEVQ